MLACLLALFYIVSSGIGLCLYSGSDQAFSLCYFYRSAIAGQLIIMVMRAVSGRLMMDFSLYTISILLYIPQRRDCCWFFFT